MLEVVTESSFLSSSGPAITDGQWEEERPLIAWAFAPNVADSHLCCFLQWWCHCKDNDSSGYAAFGGHNLCPFIAFREFCSSWPSLSHRGFTLKLVFWAKLAVYCKQALQQCFYNTCLKTHRVNKLFVACLKSCVLKPCLSLAKKIFKAKML